MPELPDLTVYADALQRFAVGRTLTAAQVPGIALLRTVDPPIGAAVGQALTGVERIGKRLVLAFANGHFHVVHLMLAGRLRWRRDGRRAPAEVQAAWHFGDERLLLTEAGKKRRAQLHILAGRAALAPFAAGGLEPLSATCEAFTEALLRERRTLKRALTDPRLFAGMGGAYGDEILHRARLSHVALTSSLPPVDIERLYQAVVSVLTEWTARLRAEVGAGFPDKVTAFHPEMAVHGRFGQPCPVCVSPVQRIVYANRETN